jgi:hypothetical protein
MQSVAEELAAEGSLTTSSDEPADRAAKGLAEYLRTQAKIAGVNPGVFRAVESPADLTKLIIEQTAAALSASGPSGAAKDLLADLPHEMEIADYLSPSDIARTVKLQGVLLALQAAQAKAELPGKEAEIDKLLAQWRTASAADTHILQQLFSGQQAALRLWLARTGL